MGQVLVSGIVIGSIYGLLALGIVLVYKGSRVLNFAQPEVGTFALFVTWQFIEWGLPWIVGAATGLLAAGLLTLAFERLVVARMTDAPRLTVAVATVGMTLFLFAVEIKIWGGSPRTLVPPIAGRGPQILGVNVSPTQFIALGVVAVLGLGLNAFLRRTDFGLGVVAAAQDPMAVRLVGVRLSRVSMFTWVTAGMLAAVASLMIAPTVGAFTAGYTTELFVFALAAALIGGLSSLTGAFVGGLAIGIIDQFVRQQFVNVSAVPGMNTVVVFALILVILLVLPQGLLVRRRA